MNTSLQTVKSDVGSIMENVLISGDLSQLSATERSMYYVQVCESVGLNPLTKPFEYITLNDKLTLYAKRDATDQLRKIYGISITIVSREKLDGVYIVTAKATNKEGREDESIGSVALEKEDGEWKKAASGKNYFAKNGKTLPLRGDDLANAIMKAETKSKRRVTLSICGLGLLDETELETIRDLKTFDVSSVSPATAAKIENNEEYRDIPAHLQPKPESKSEYRPNDPVRPGKDQYVIGVPVAEDGSLDFTIFAEQLTAAIEASKTINEVSMFNRANAKSLKQMQIDAPELFKKIGEIFRSTSQCLM